MKINHRTKLLSAGIICALMSGNVMAQEADFDLSSQRSEKQDVKPVPGKKIDHQGIVINPTPHQISVDRNQTCSLLEGIVLKDKQKAFANDLGFLKQQKKDHRFRSQGSRPSECQIRIRSLCTEHRKEGHHHHRIRRKRCLLRHTDPASADGKRSGCQGNTAFRRNQ